MCLGSLGSCVSLLLPAGSRPIPSRNTCSGEVLDSNEQQETLSTWLNCVTVLAWEE